MIYVTETENKTIASIADISNTGLDEKTLAFAYMGAKTMIIAEIDSSTNNFGYVNSRMEFYEITGFPDFPISK